MEPRPPGWTVAGLARLARLEGVLDRYPAWVMEHARPIVWCCALLSVLALGLAATLPLRTEFSWLLPDRQPSVIALRQLTARKPSSAVIEVGIASPSAEATRRFAADLAQRLRQTLPKELLREVDEDDGSLRRFIWDHRFLYATLSDLHRARDELRRRIAAEKEKRNPFLVDLEEEDAGPKNAAKKDGRKAEDPMADLRGKLAEAREQAQRPPGFVGEQGRLRMLVVRCLFGDTEPQKGQAVLQHIRAAVLSLRPQTYDPQLDVGYAGDPVTTAVEHDLVLRDVALSTTLCLALVMALLLGALRAPWAVLALCLSLAAGCALTFGLTRIFVGHLNSSTAFLGSVVAGNGINFGVIFLSRYLEERRRSVVHSAALRTSLSQTALPTLVAAGAAGTAYLSLIITSFRGFSEFGIIAGSGMVLCWASSYLVLPALLSLFEHRRKLVRDARSRLYRRLDLRWGHPHLLRGGALLVVIGSLLLGIYGGLRLSQDPFEDDLRSLRSRSLPKSPLGQWSRRLDASFGKNQSGGFYLGVERAEDVPVVLQAVAEAEQGVPPEKRIFGVVDALPNVLPGTLAEQREKIAVLSELRHLIDEIEPTVDPGSEDGRLLSDLRPEAALQPVSVADLPVRLRQAFTEQNGRMGLLIAIHPGPGFDNWSYRGNRQAVTLLRSLRLPAEVKRTLQLSGAEVIYVDMMEAVQRDGPRATALSLVLVLVLLLLAFSPGRDLIITTFALFAGTFGMLGLMALLHVRLNFLNYIAVPITIGIGVDYPFNVMARLRQDLSSGGQLRTGLLQTGSAVVLCSMTTIIGYAVLLLSDTGAIRSFGMAAVLGEFTSIFAAIVIVPCLLVGLGRLRGSKEPTR